MAAFVGQLKSNEIFSALYNMIISQQVFADNIGAGYALVDKARVDGTLYGDTKLYYATDALKSTAWGNDSEANNLLALHRPPAPECQAITIDQFRQISLTVDNYLSKRAWADEGSFSSFNSVMLGWIGDTKKIYDQTTYNAFIGTAKSSITSQNPVVNLTAGGRTSGENIAEMVANIIADLKDTTRKYNDYGNLRSFDESDIKIVWNPKYVNEVKKVDLPSIFHSDMLQSTFDGDQIPTRYFGNIVSTSAASVTANTVRSLKEADYTVGATTTHCFAGDFIPAGASVSANASFTTDDSVICKIYTKLPPYMSGFEVGTSFFNPKSLTENHYLTFGHNSLEYLKNYPMITLSSTTGTSTDVFK